MHSISYISQTQSAENIFQAQMVLTTQVTWLLGKTGCFATFYKHSFGTLILNTSWFRNLFPLCPTPTYYLHSIFSRPSTMLLQITPSSFYRKTRWREFVLMAATGKCLIPQFTYGTSLCFLVRKGSQLFSFIYASKTSYAFLCIFSLCALLIRPCHQAGNRHWEILSSLLECTYKTGLSDRNFSLWMKSVQ